MNINDYMRIIRKYIYIPVVLVILATGLSLYQTSKNPNLYSGSVTFTVGNKLSNKTDISGYNNYYSLATATILSDSIIGWLASPNIINQIYQDAGYPISNTKVSNLGKRIHYQKPAASASVIIAMVEEETKEEADAILKSIVKVVSQQVSVMESQAALPPGLTIISTDPAVLVEKVNTLTSAIVAGSAGLILGIALCLMLGAFKGQNNR